MRDKKQPQPQREQKEILRKSFNNAQDKRQSSVKGIVPTVPPPAKPPIDKSDKK